MTPTEQIKQARALLDSAGKTLTDQMKSDRSRRRGTIARELHAVSQMRVEVPPYFSQAGQDRIVDAVLGRKMGGVFVDVGGYDGVTGSNSLFFETFRGWTGVLVEPAPTQVRKAEAVRRCPCLGYAVAGEAGELRFMEVTKGYTQMSGFLDSYDPNLLERVRSDPRHEEIVHTLQTKTLNSILSENSIDHVDFLSLDVEGGEVSILSNFDFDAVDVEIWSIENNAQDSVIPELMRDNGFDLIEFAGVDDIFRKRNAG